MSPAPHPRGRFAPSPTGPLHLGSLVSALGSWLFARRAGGDWLLRIEDLDPPREIAGAADGQIRVLAALGLVPDQAIVWQSTRHAAYEQALSRLLDAGLAFECRCSRSDVAAAGGVHRACASGTAAQARPAAVRLRVPEVQLGFTDRNYGDVVQDIGRDVGDFVLRRADGHWAYQFAVVVDDAWQGITDVVRGADLLHSTPRQRFLQQQLGLPTPGYLHLPLVLGTDGEKLGKSNGAVAVDAGEPLAALRAAWAALGQQRDALPAGGSPEAALATALQNFEPAHIPHPSPPQVHSPGND